MPHGLHLMLQGRHRLLIIQCALVVQLLLMVEGLPFRKRIGRIMALPQVADNLCPRRDIVDTRQEQCPFPLIAALNSPACHCRRRRVRPTRLAHF